MQDRFRFTKCDEGWRAPSPNPDIEHIEMCYSGVRNNLELDVETKVFDVVFHQDEPDTEHQFFELVESDSGAVSIDANRDIEWLEGAEWALRAAWEDDYAYIEIIPDPTTPDPNAPKQPVIEDRIIDFAIDGSNEWRSPEGALLCREGFNDYVDIPSSVNQMRARCTATEPDHHDCFGISEPNDEYESRLAGVGLRLYDNTKRALAGLHNEGYRFVIVEYPR